MKEKNQLPKDLIQHAPWDKQTNPIWPASAFVLHRNLNKYLFPSKLPDLQMHQVLQIIEEVVKQNPLLSASLFLKAEELDGADKEFLFERFLCLEGFQNTTTGQGFFLDPTYRLLGLINVQDHLQLHCIDTSGEWEKTWNTLSEIDAYLSRSLEIAYHPRFGYLTSAPRLSGTGLTVQIYLHLPALIHTHQLEETLIKQQTDDVTVLSMQGPLQEIVGDIIVLKNTYTLGISEENILHSVHLAAMKLITLEKALRSHLRTNAPAPMKDLVSRAFGLLIHSYQLQTKETMQALSLLRLGLDLGWVSQTSQEKLLEPFFRCRRAHLMHEFQNKELSAEELPHKRAEWLHTFMRNIQLEI